MTARFEVPTSLRRFIGCLNPAGRRHIFSVAANALKILVQGHIRANVPRHHASASRLGASPTGHHEKGASRITGHSNDSMAEVVIPIAGMGRAFHDVNLRPKRATRLTIPVNALSYGRRAAEMKRLGWSVFKPNGRDVLMGKRKGSKDAAIALYALKSKVLQRQDRSLLPSDESIRLAATKAISSEITRLAS